MLNTVWNNYDTNFMRLVYTVGLITKGINIGLTVKLMSVNGVS